MALLLMMIIMPMIVTVVIVPAMVVSSMVISAMVVPPAIIFVAVFFHAFVGGAVGGAFTFPAFPLFVAFFVARPIETPGGVRMNISCAVYPGPPPTNVVDVDGAVLPYDAVSAPSPWPEDWPHGHAEAEADPGPNIESWPRRNINNCR